MAKGDYKLALIDATKALDMFNEVNDVTRAADTNKLLGDLESLQANYNESYNYYLNAINVYKEQNDVQNCGDYRGINLLSHTMRIWERIIDGKLRAEVEVSKELFVFIPGQERQQIQYLF